MLCGMFMCCSVISALNWRRSKVMNTLCCDNIVRMLRISNVNIMFQNISRDVPLNWDLLMWCVICRPIFLLICTNLIWERVLFMELLYVIHCLACLDCVFVNWNRHIILWMSTIYIGTRNSHRFLHHTGAFCQFKLPSYFSPENLKLNIGFNAKLHVNRMWKAVVVSCECSFFVNYVRR